MCSITDHLARRNLFFTKIMSLKTTIVCVQELTICPAAIYFSRKISHLKTQSCVFKNCQYPQPPNFFFPEKSVILNNHPVCSRTVHCPSRNLFFQKNMSLNTQQSRLSKNRPYSQPHFFPPEKCVIKKKSIACVQELTISTAAIFLTKKYMSFFVKP